MNFKINNYYFLVLWRIFLVYILFTLCRAVFIAVNFSLLEPLTGVQIWRIFTGGLMFDNTAILYTNILYLFLSFLPFAFVKGNIFQQIIKYLYIVTNFILIAVNLMDTIYFRFSLRRTSMTFFTEFKGDVKFMKIFLESISLYWYIFLIGIIFLLILILFSGTYGKKGCKYDVNLSNSVKYFNHKGFGYKFYVYQIVALLITAPLFIIGVRGGATRTMRPITLSNANDFVDRAIHTSAVLNTPFSLIRTIGKNKFQYQRFFSDSTLLEQTYTPMHPVSATLPDTLLQNRTIKLVEGNSLAGKNVVILILESFAAKNMSFLNKNLDKNYTPFLDSLSKQGVLCTNAFANGAKSIDAVPSILASLPSLINSYAVTPYSTDQLHGLPAIFGEMGYYTSFFHGAPNNSMGIRAVASSCGIKNYYGKDEYNNNADFDGAWGIWDELFLQFVGKKISTFEQPFFTSVFTLSSHHPFKVPDQYKDVLPHGETPLQSAIAYTDMSLRKFFQSIKHEPWFANTVFIITPDHGTFDETYPKYVTSLGHTMIPIIYYAPALIQPGVYSGVTQQIDIMPTLLGLMQYKKPFFAYGRDINSNSTPFAINYVDNLFQLIKPILYYRTIYCREPLRTPC
ncbi:MAG: sulfatase-like hydrolase/transferase [Bacteroidales bacterium]